MTPLFVMLSPSGFGLVSPGQRTIQAPDDAVLTVWIPPGTARLGRMVRLLEGGDLLENPSSSA